MREVFTKATGIDEEGYKILNPSQWLYGSAMTGDNEDKLTAMICCPQCWNAASLSNHQIDENGLVHPSVACSHDGCDYHEYITLEGWLDD